MANHKLKLLYIAKMLIEQTDENHTVTVNDIIDYLGALGISAERRTIYADLELLGQYGLDIEKRKTKTHDYYIASREFELPELKLLIDVVQASHFITHKKSMELISKLESLASRPNAKQLRRQVYVYNRVKSINENLYYNIDGLHTAINENKMINFRYFDWSLDKTKVYRKEGHQYITSPVALCVEKNYYLIAYSDRWKNYVHYRVDRMSDIKVLEEKRTVDLQKFDLANYVKKIFDMYDGEPERVKIVFNNSLANPVMDRFGKDVVMRKADEEIFEISVEVAVSPTFISWVIGFGQLATVASPAWVIDEVCKLAHAVIDQYE